MPEEKCMICGEEMPAKSYCSKFHKELEMMWDGNQPDNRKEISIIKGQGQEDHVGKASKNVCESKTENNQSSSDQEVLSWLQEK